MFLALQKDVAIATNFVCIKSESTGLGCFFVRNSNVLISVLPSRTNREGPTRKPHRRWVITAGTGKQKYYLLTVYKVVHSILASFPPLLIERLEADRKCLILPFLLRCSCARGSRRSRWRHSGSPVTNITLKSVDFVLLAEELLYTAFMFFCLFVFFVASSTDVQSKLYFPIRLVENMRHHFYKWL